MKLEREKVVILAVYEILWARILEICCECCNFQASHTLTTIWAYQKTVHNTIYGCMSVVVKIFSHCRLGKAEHLYDIL